MIKPKKSGMNVLLVLADQMRGQALGCVGNQQVHTPNIDRLAAGGVVMRRAYANSPVCTPSRGSLLTGCYPLRHGAIANDIPIRADIRGMGEIFKEAGYSTGYIGKWHLDGCPRDKFTPPGARRLGFDYWAVHNCAHDYFNSFYYADTPQRIDIPGYEPERQTELALSFISEQGRSRPFCLVLSWGQPHDPYDAVPERFRKMYNPAAIELRPNVPQDCAEQARCELAGYYAQISALDELFGRLLDRLDELGLAEETLVVFTSDHGDMLHSHGRRRKQQPWEESVNIPLILRKPRAIPAGEIGDGLIAVTDILPTILHLVGIQADAHMQGRDLSASITAGARGLDEVLIGEICPVDEGLSQGVAEWRGLRTGRYTYARTLEGPWVLYDNSSDPYQLRNLADEAEYEKLRQELERRLRDKLSQAEDTFLPWRQMIRRCNLIEPWNKRELELHGRDAGRFV